MQKKAIWAVLGTMLAVMIASITLALAVGPRTSAAQVDNGIVTVSDWDDFEIDGDGVLTGLSSSFYENVLRFEGTPHSGYWYDSNTIDFDEIYVYIPNGVTKIGNGSCIFSGDIESQLRYVKIPDSVIEIDENAFYGCENLKVFIPSSVETIGHFAFVSTKVTYCEADYEGDDWNEEWRYEVTKDVCDEVTYYIPSHYYNGDKYGCDLFGDYVVQGAAIDKSGGCTYTIVGYVGHDSCAQIPYEINGDDVVKIGHDAFVMCNFEEICIPNTVTQIEGSAFWECPNLSFVVIPDSVETVGEAIFMYCDNLDEINCEADEKPGDWARYWDWNENWMNDYNTIVDPENPVEVDSDNNGWVNNVGHRNVIWGWRENVPVEENPWLNVVNSYYVDFESNGGTDVDAQFVDEGDVVEIPNDPTRTGYDFRGWYYDEELTDEYDFENEVWNDFTLFAKWEIQHLTVTFDACGGDAVNFQTVDYGDKITNVPTTEYTGHDFLGWFEDLQDAEVFDFDKTITANTTLFAKWDLVNYIVAFNTNGGSTAVAQEIVHGQYATAPTTTKTGYTFAGWYANTNLTQAFDFDAAITSSCTVYAKWTINQYTVTFNSNDGSTVNAQTVDYNTKAVEPNKPVRENYNFDYWYLNNENQAFDFNTPITTDLTLNAKWTENLNNDEPSESETVIDNNSASSRVTATNKNNNNLIVTIAGCVCAAGLTMVSVMAIIILKKRK